MRIAFGLGSLIAMMFPFALPAEQPVTPVSIAEASGACGPFGVASAVLNAEGVISVTCNEDATAFVPLLGGLGPILGLGVAATVVGAIADGNSTPDTR